MNIQYYPRFYPPPLGWLGGKKKWRAGGARKNGAEGQTYRGKKVKKAEVLKMQII